MPGVRYEDGIEALGEDFGTLIPQVGGQRRHWNSVTVDGLIGNEASGSNRMSSAINLDAIAEVKVLLNTYKAEFGHSGGANIQIVSKSGGADYSGSTLLLRAARRLERQHVGEQPRRASPKPEYHFDTYGFNLGGPGADSRTLVGNGPTRSCSSSTRSKRRAASGRRTDAPLPAADRARAARRLLADASITQGRADLHQGSAEHRRVQHHDGRRRLLPEQQDSGRTASIATAWRC